LFQFLLKKDNWITVLFSQEKEIFYTK